MSNQKNNSNLKHEIDTITNSYSIDIRTLGTGKTSIDFIDNRFKKFFQCIDDLYKKYQENVNETENQNEEIFSKQEKADKEAFTVLQNKVSKAIEERDYQSLKFENEIKLNSDFIEKENRILGNENFNIIQQTNEQIYKLQVEKEKALNLIEIRRKSYNRNYDKLLNDFIYSRDYNNKNYLSKRKTSQNRFELLLQETNDFYRKKRLEIENKNKIETDEILAKIEAVKNDIREDTLKMNLKVQQLNNEYHLNIKASNEQLNAELENIDKAKKEIEKKYDLKQKEILQTFKDNLIECDVIIDRIKESYNEKEASIISIFQKDHNEIKKDIEKIEEKYLQSISQIDNRYESLLSSTQDKKRLKNIKQIKNKEKAQLLKNKKLEIEVNEKRQKELVNLYRQNMQELSSNYIVKIESKKLDKLVFEIEKNYLVQALKIASEQEISIFNKKAEELKNAYETKKTINGESDSQKLENIRYAHDVKVNNLETQIKVLQNKTSMLNRTAKINIGYTNDLNNKELKCISGLKDLTNNSFESTINTNQVLSTLEIEKNNLLREYNHKIASIDEYHAFESFTLGTNFVNLKATASHKNKAFEFAKIKEEKEHASKIINLEKEFLVSRKENDINYYNDIFKNDVQKSKYEVYVAKSNAESQLIIQNYQTFTKVIQETTILLKDLIKHFYDEAIIYASQQFLYFETYNKIYIAIHDFLLETLKHFSDEEKRIITDRINFETGKKYQTLLEEEDKIYKKENDRLNERIRNFSATIKKYQSIINDYSHSNFKTENESNILKKEAIRIQKDIIDIKNDTSIDKNEKRRILKYNRQMIKKNIQTIKNNTNDVNEKNLKIINNEKLIERMNKDISHTQGKADSLYKGHLTKIANIKSKQKKESFIYYNAINYSKRQANSFEELLSRKYPYLLINYKTDVIISCDNYLLRFDNIYNALFKIINNKFVKTYLYLNKAIKNENAKMKSANEEQESLVDKKHKKEESEITSSYYQKLKIEKKKHEKELETLYFSHQNEIRKNGLDIKKNEISLQNLEAKTVNDKCQSLINFFTDLKALKMNYTEIKNTNISLQNQITLDTNFTENSLKKGLIESNEIKEDKLDDSKKSYKNEATNIDISSDENKNSLKENLQNSKKKHILLVKNIKLKEKQNNIKLNKQHKKELVNYDNKLAYNEVEKNLEIKKLKKKENQRIQKEASKVKKQSISVD